MDTVVYSYVTFSYGNGEMGYYDLAFDCPTSDVGYMASCKIGIVNERVIDVSCLDGVYYLSYSGNVEKTFNVYCGSVSLITGWVAYDGSSISVNGNESVYLRIEVFGQSEDLGYIGGVYSYVETVEDAYTLNAYEYANLAVLSLGFVVVLCSVIAYFRKRKRCRR